MILCIFKGKQKYSQTVNYKSFKNGGNKNDKHNKHRTRKKLFSQHR